MKKSQKILNILLVFAILLFDIFYITRCLPVKSIVIKSIASILFVTLGTVNLVFALKQKTSAKKFCTIMMIGLFFAMLGDIILEIEFIVGALLFAIGHVFFFASYCTLQKLELKNLIASVCIFVPATLLITLTPFFDFGGVLMEFVCVAYALVISIMVGKSIANYTKNKSKLNLILLIGSVLFMFSDIMLLFNVFADISKIFGILCLSTYYPAEILLAFSISQTNKK